MNNVRQDKVIKYSFFTAGHTYGNASNYIYGMHPPFVKAIPYINNYPKMKLGMLTGDVVPNPTAAYWDSAQATISQFNFPVHIASGNHDRGPEFLNRFQTYYHSFVFENDLFVVLTPNNKWNIDKWQKNMLSRALINHIDNVNHVFIFLHELIWWAPDNKFGNIEINYRPHFPGHSNFYSEVKPMLDTLSKKVVFFAGDLGNTTEVDSYMYYKEGNITLIANGMGNGVSDNIVIVEVYNNDSINYKLMGLNSPIPYEIERLEDYVLP